MLENKITIKFIPRQRLMSLRFIREASRSAMVHFLAEFDVTECLRRFDTIMAVHKIKPSLTAYLAWCLGSVVREHPDINSFLLGGKRIVTFEDVDVAIAVEYTVQGESRLRYHTIRAVNKKSFLEITRELDACRATPEPGGAARGAKLGLLSLMQKAASGMNPLSYWLWKRLMRNPYTRQKIEGTTVVSSMGMKGKGASFFAVPRGGRSFGLTVGSISKEPKVVGNEIMIRDILKATLSVDHFIMDGASITRFLVSLQEGIERGPLVDG